ncbi:MAG: TonB-dependent receptor, partial [Ignavibacteriaceae bacterium]
DPQTGHHSFNLPVNVDNIDRIEILKGQGSRSFGANAFSGVINYITKKQDTKKIFAQALGGQHGLFDLSLNTSYSYAGLNNHVSLSKRKSDGYRHNTGFDAVNFIYNSFLNLGSSKLNFLFGYNDKEFGANGFYASAFPNQWERTTTKLLGAGGEFGNELFSLSPKFYWRRNNDRFLLNYEDPSFYENNHQTDVLGFEIQSSVTTAFGVTAFGGEFTKDEINSNNLGNHSRENKGLFAEHKFSPVDDFTVVAGAFVYDYALIGWKFWPGVDFSYNFMPGMQLTGSAGKAFRIPTYTELYYSDPVSQGSIVLRHEETVNYELGFNHYDFSYSFHFALFRKEGKNIIDWVKNSSESRWTAMNIAQLNTNGLETEFKIYPASFISNFPIISAGINYTYLDIKRELMEFTSRYALDHLKQQLVISVNTRLPFNITQLWIFRYEDRIDLEDNFITDMHINYNLTEFNIFIKVSNLFNKSYRDFSNLSLPGRWITTGLNTSLSLK